MSLPTNISGFDLPGFQAWLESHGAELRDPTNEWEVVRYMAPSSAGQKPSIHIVYRNAKGALNYQGWANKHYKDFMRGRTLGEPSKTAARPAKPKSSSQAALTGHKRRSIVARLTERDGNACWFCGEFFEGDRSIEHLLARSIGGNNRLENLVLAHEKCNGAAENKPVAEKVLMRDALLAKHATTPPWESVRP